MLRQPFRLRGSTP